VRCDETETETKESANPKEKEKHKNIKTKPRVRGEYDTIAERTSAGNDEIRSTKRNQKERKKDAFISYMSKKENVNEKLKNAPHGETVKRRRSSMIT